MAKPGFSFSFSKKAEPKRVVEALVTKNHDGRIAVTAMEDGAIKVDKVEEEAKQLVISCKNLLQDLPTKPHKPVADCKERSPKIDEEKGGLQSMKPVISDEDAEALAALKSDAVNDGDSESQVAVAPILMREGSKRNRSAVGDATATKEMFETVPVEAFGAALLRGMGYDPEKHSTKPIYFDKPRDNLLGLGAKALLPSEKSIIKGKGKGTSPQVASEDKFADNKAVGEPLQKRVRSEGGSPASPSDQKPASPSPPTAANEPSAGSSPGGPQIQDTWASRGLFVRVRKATEDKRLRDFRGRDAVVLDADSASRTCRIKARLGEKSHVLQDVSLDDIDPVVGPDCAKVRVIRGIHAGDEVKLLHRSERRSIARVRIHDSEHELPLRDVCEFIAPKR